MKKHISLILAVLMLASVFGFASCSEQTVNDVLDAALAVVEALPDESDAGENPAEEAAQTAEETEFPETEAPETKAPETKAPETEAHETKAPETKAPETKAPETKAPETEAPTTAEKTPVIDENGYYDDKDNVALYIHTYGKLPPNYVSKNDAERLYGWEGGALDKYAEGMAIGGSKFGNYEGILPKKSGRQYYECDIDTVGSSARGAKRIVYSNDGLIYYTDDHYESFELLYGEE